jgi:hypothetical protein
LKKTADDHKSKVEKLENDIKSMNSVMTEKDTVLKTKNEELGKVKREVKSQEV